MSRILPKHTSGIIVRDDVSSGTIGDDVLFGDKPIVLKGLVARWPIVTQTRDSVEQACDYLKSRYSGCPITLLALQNRYQGRLFYNESMNGLNFTRRKVSLLEALDSLTHAATSDASDAFYIGSTTVTKVFPDFEQEHTIGLEAQSPLTSVWIGNQTKIAAHYDLPQNIACVVTGRRRFTLFPPAQIENLYPGPLDLTPAGQQISMVDFDTPDLTAHPKFEIAAQHAQVAVLEPGDAIFIPSMWWHHVEGLDQLNILVNYWWRNTPAYMSNPMHVLNHAFLEIRDLPAHQKEAWRALLDYFIFDDQEHKYSHIPEQLLGRLKATDEVTSRKLRTLLLNSINR